MGKRMTPLSERVTVDCWQDGKSRDCGGVGYGFVDFRAWRYESPTLISQMRSPGLLSSESAGTYRGRVGRVDLPRSLGSAVT